MAEREPRTRQSDDRTGRTTTRRRRSDEPQESSTRKTTRSRTRESDGSHRDAEEEDRSRRTAEHQPEPDGSDEPRSRRKAGPGISARKAAAIAARCVQELTGRRPEGLTSLERTEDGWRVGVEALESRRVPDTTDILAVYQVDVDDDGELLSYRRERRYHRGMVEGEEQ